MIKFWRVAWHEYTRHVLRRRFLLALLSVPLLIGFTILLVFFTISLEMDPTPVGYVDASGLLANPLPPPAVESPERPVPMQSFESAQAAEAALQAGEIQAYYVLPADYLQTGQAQVFYNGDLKDSAYDQFTDFLAVNLLRSQPPEVAARLVQGSDMVVRAVESSREASDERWFNVVLPFFLGIVFIAAMSTSSGYLTQAVVEEKENRTMEIIITSVSPVQLMAGKIIGDIAIGLTQLGVWLVFIVLGISIGGRYVSWLQQISLPVEVLALAAVVLAPAFVMFCALTAASATVTEGREAQQVTGLFSLVIWLPYFFIALLIEHPNSRWRWV
jgi:ABC-2 type transport system permease protein